MSKYMLVNVEGHIIAFNNDRDFLIARAKEAARETPGCKFFLAVVALEFEAPHDGVSVRDVPS